MNNLDFDSMTNDEVAKALKLDQEEQELLESIENKEWINAPNMEQEIQQFQAIAQHQLMTQKIELQISMQDTNKIQELENQLGLSVSSFAQDIIHKYLAGELIEKIQIRGRRSPRSKIDGSSSLSLWIS